MSIQALGYLGVGSDKFDDWTAFAVNGLGSAMLLACKAVVPDYGPSVRRVSLADRPANTTTAGCISAGYNAPPGLKEKATISCSPEFAIPYWQMSK